MLALLLVLLPMLTTPMSATMAHGRMMPVTAAAGPVATHVDAGHDGHDGPNHAQDETDEGSARGVMAGCFACPACPACPFAVPLALPELPPAPMAREFVHSRWPQPPAPVPSPPLEPPRA